MTNEELKKKIVKVIDNWANNAVKAKRSGASVYDPYNAAELAAALIAAGIGDLKEHRIFAGKDGSIKQLYSGEEVEQIVKEREEYKHRAEVAERALLRACKINAIFAEADVPNILAESALYRFYLQQAEKELAEERKDD